jgi:cytochrome bd-type quinol oxidase subunit 2
VPRTSQVLTLRDPASSLRTQTLLADTLLPLIILMYVLTDMGWSYWIFRGKARGDTAYH